MAKERETAEENETCIVNTVTRHLGLCMCHVQTQRSGVTVQDVTIIGGMTYCIVGNFRERRLSQISRFCGYLQKFSLRNLGEGVLRQH